MDVKGTRQSLVLALYRNVPDLKTKDFVKDEIKQSLCYSISDNQMCYILKDAKFE